MNFKISHKRNQMLKREAFSSFHAYISWNSPRSLFKEPGREGTGHIFYAARVWNLAAAANSNSYYPWNFPGRCAKFQQNKMFFMHLPS